MASVKKYVFGSYNNQYAKVRLLTKGKDGATWYSGDPAAISYCKTGDFCFDPETYDIYKCKKGGIGTAAEWDCICNLDATGEIGKLRTEYTELLASLSDMAAFSPWWFGTREEYNAMTSEEKAEYSLHFIEEGS